MIIIVEFEFLCFLVFFCFFFWFLRFALTLRIWQGDGCTVGNWIVDFMQIVYILHVLYRVCVVLYEFQLEFRGYLSCSNMCFVRLPCTHPSSLAQNAEWAMWIRSTLVKELLYLNVQAFRDSLGTRSSTYNAWL